MKPNVTLRSLSRRLLAASVLAAVTGFVATAQAQSLAYGQRMPPPVVEGRTKRPQYRPDWRDHP